MLDNEMVWGHNYVCINLKNKYHTHILGNLQTTVFIPYLPSQYFLTCLSIINTILVNLKQFNLFNKKTNFLYKIFGLIY